MYRIAYNTAISYVRKKRPEYLAIEESQISNASEEEVADFFGYVDQSEQIRWLEESLDKLSADDRGLVLLYYMQDKSVDELTGITGLSASNVKTRLFRVRKKLFILMKEMEKKYNE